MKHRSDSDIDSSKYTPSGKAKHRADKPWERTSTVGYCYSVEDGMDGYFVHIKDCIHWPSGASGGGNCMRREPRYRFVCTCGHPGAGCYC